MRARVAVCAVISILASFAAVPGRAQVAQEAQAGCGSAGGDARSCRGVYHLVELAGVLCRQAGGGRACANVDGRAIDKNLVRADEQSWLTRTLAAQRTLDDTEPLQEEQWSHTHNSFNAEAYRLTVYGLDPNQLYSITDQLRMGIRAIEIDIHWALEPDGTPAHQFKRVAVCHGDQIGLGVHLGCGLGDPTLTDRLVEVRDWLQDHPEEVVMIYLENQLENNRTAHIEARQQISSVLGDLVYRPPAGSGCATLPMDTSRADIRSAGKRVIITGNCGPGTWRDWVFDRGPRWIENGTDYGDDYPASCTAERAAKHYDRNWIRYWGDETGLSNGTGGGGDITVHDAQNMTRCGVNMIGLDNLRPFDPRLLAQIWSWAPNEPSPGAVCAYQTRGGSFRGGDCAQQRRFACRTGTDWVVTTQRGAWAQGPAACAAAGAHYDVPSGGWQNQLLITAKGSGEVWLDYAKRSGRWTPRVL